MLFWKVMLVICCALCGLSFIVHAVKHGQPRDDNYNFALSICDALVAWPMFYFAAKWIWSQ